MATFCGSQFAFNAASQALDVCLLLDWISSLCSPNPEMVQMDPFSLFSGGSFVCASCCSWVDDS